MPRRSRQPPYWRDSGFECLAPSAIEGSVQDGAAKVMEEDRAARSQKRNGPLIGMSRPKGSDPPSSRNTNSFRAGRDVALDRAMNRPPATRARSSSPSLPVSHGDRRSESRVDVRATRLTGSRHRFGRRCPCWEGSRAGEARRESGDCTARS